MGTYMYMGTYHKDMGTELCILYMGTYIFKTYMDTHIDTLYNKFIK